METNCGSINEEYIGKSVELYGWCRYIRDHGGKLFIDLADKHGTVQLVFEGEIKTAADELGKEYVVKIAGKVERRDLDTIDKENPTGKVEIYVASLDLISKAKIPPFELIEEKKKFLANEELRFEYRYIDLRRPEMVKNVVFRDRVTKSIRKYFWDNDFMELETPTLIRDTYETGSKTFLVPSRTMRGEFYSLPQSPQLYKQMCMIAGLEKYFQIARCYRDEDPREDRQPEFTQVDIEVSFKDETYIQGLMERMFQRVFKEVLNKDLKLPFRHMSFRDAIQTYGSDKPDLRYDSKIFDITEDVTDTDYNILKRVIENGGRVKAIAFDAHYGDAKSKINKNYMLKIIEFAKGLGLRGLTWLYVEHNAIASEPESIAYSLKDCEKRIRDRLGAGNGDLVIIGADLSEKLLLESLGKVRKIICDDMGNQKTDFAFLWINEFPMFEKDEITGKYKSSHNPFTSPIKEHYPLLDTDPEKVVSRQYDLVLNGIELGSGSIRITDPEIQRKIFKIMGTTDKNIDKTFGFVINALSYGTPIHGGIALGLDRTVALLAGGGNMKDFLLFPKNKRFELLVDGAPTKIDGKRLKDDFGINMDID